MEQTKLRKRLKRGHDAGFSLMEVIVAIAIMAIVATAGASLTFNGIATSTAQERAQVAVTIANGALETVSGWSTKVNAATGVNNIYAGRGKLAVTNAFSANSTLPGVSQTVPTWDTSLSATSTSDGLIPIVTPDPATSAPFIPQNGTNYTVTTLLGTCYEQLTITSATKSNGSANPNECTTTPGSAPVALIRAIVIVRWTAGTKCKAATGCYYETSTLLDPTVDLEWVTH